MKKNKELRQLEDLSNASYNIFKNIQKQGMSSTKKITLKVSLGFQFEFKLTFIFALLVFKVHQHLDFVSTSSMFRWLELATMIVAKPTVIGMTIGMTFPKQALLERLCWSASTFFF